MEFSWQVYAITSVLLFLKLLSTAVVQGFVRIKTKTFRHFEDAAFFTRTSPSDMDHPVAITASNIFRNDLENIPIFLFLLIGYIQLDCWEEGSAIYSTLFVFSRILHAIFYFIPRQPWRNISYDLGIASMFALSGHILYSIFTL